MEGQMKSQVNSVKPRIGAVVSIAVVVGLTGVVTFSSLHPIPLGLVFGGLGFVLLSLVFAILTFASLVTGWQQATRVKKGILTVGVVLCIVASAGALYAIWPSSPMGETSADRIMRDFMADLKAGNYRDAMAKLTPAARQCPAIIKAFKNPDNRPIYWYLIGRGDYWDVSGRAEFSDGAELPFKIQFTWQWSKACWLITGVQFGESPGDARIYFLEVGKGSRLLFKK
jgi:hypothetical protein